MTYQALARTWRPRTFTEVVGQKHVVTALSNALDTDRVHHAYLFAGTRGVGKTTLARIFAKALNCEQGMSSQPCGGCNSCRAIEEGRFVDLIEVDAASRTKVDDTRELLDNVQYAPTLGRYKIYLIDEVHMLSGHSFNALLKTLEEPPPHVKFLLATTDPQKLPVTVLSRCLQFNLKALDPAQIVARLEEIVAAESIDFDTRALELLARSAQGSLRDALSLLDQGIAHGNGAVREDAVRGMLGMIDEGFVYDLLDDIARQDAAGALTTVASMAERTVDFVAALDDLLLALHHLSLMRVAPQALASKGVDTARLEALGAALSAEDLQLCYQIGLIGKRDLPLAPDPLTGFEMVLIRMIAFQPAGSAADSPGQAPRRAMPPSAPRRAPRPASADKGAGVRSASAAAGDGPPDPEAWARLVADSDLGGMARELAMNLAPSRGEDGGVVLVLEERHRHLRSPERDRAVLSAIERHFGAGVGVRFQVGGEQRETPAQYRSRRVAEKQQAAAEAVAQDPNVQQIIERFEATIVPESVQPGDGDS